MANSISLGIGVSMLVSDPFLVELKSGKCMIAQAESMYNEHGDLIWYQENVIDHDPDKKKVFLMKLKGVEYDSRVDWDEFYVDTQDQYTPPNKGELSVAGNIGSGSYWSREGN